MDISIGSIDHYPNKSFGLTFYGFRFFDFRVNLNETVQKKLDGETLTNTIALKIFKQIKWQSNVLSFLTKPLVFIPISTVVLAAGLMIPTSGIILTVAALATCILGGAMFGISIREPFGDHFLSQVSTAYKDQSVRAAEYIKRLGSPSQESFCATANSLLQSF